MGTVLKKGGNSSALIYMGIKLYWLNIPRETDDVTSLGNR